MSCRPGAQELKKKKENQIFDYFLSKLSVPVKKPLFFFFFLQSQLCLLVFTITFIFLQTAVHPSWVWSNLLICIICLRSLDSLSLMMPQSRDWPDWHCHIYSGNNRQPYHFIGPEKLIYNIIFSLCVSSSLSCSSVDQDCLWVRRLETTCVNLGFRKREMQTLYTQTALLPLGLHLLTPP